MAAAEPLPGRAATSVVVAITRTAADAAHFFIRALMSVPLRFPSSGLRIES
ncbi:hypothetical protein GCM10010109_51750 [Actinoplanes campanulatus]|nr:hypothetical protein GCM10010109_51750 [Actinoplanes campanulatus]GID41325.1 hypothetical protein Aca09nite_78310 [Actinoplanes campanulatus]